MRVYGSSAGALSETRLTGGTGPRSFQKKPLGVITRRASSGASSCASSGTSSSGTGTIPSVGANQLSEGQCSEQGLLYKGH